MNDIEPVVIGALSDEKCNEGRQYHLQHRVYDSSLIATSLTTGFYPKYLVKEKK